MQRRFACLLNAEGLQYSEIPMATCEKEQAIDEVAADKVKHILFERW